MKRYTKGFTLIELLVVIAIIGILASVVLVSLQSARSKGKDSRVMSDVQQLRTQLESDYTGSAYTITTANTFPTGANYTTLTTDATNQGGPINLVSASPFTSYAIYGRLPSSPSTAYRYFCIDSTGKTNPSDTQNTAATCTNP